jgi:DNA replication and repair protein RecF
MGISRQELSYRIDMHLKQRKSKGIAINGVSIKKASELFGIVNIIFFSPEDLSIIKSSPQVRRKFMDSELCQLNKQYLYNLSNYNKVLNNRNKLLKDIFFRPELKETLFLWDEQMIEYGRNIIKKRREFVYRLNELVKEIHIKLSGGRERLSIEYVPNTTEEMLESAIKNGHDADLRRKMTLSGPHRDDLCFYINDTNIHKFGSQGQQRTAALSLKMAEIELVKEFIKDTPVLLLDDVLSELDSNRQNHLLNSISNLQTFITCTGLDEFVNNRFEVNKVFKVCHGNAAVEN